MFIDEVLRKYPQLPRPDAVFDIQNVAEYVSQNMNDRIAKWNIFEESLSMRPPFLLNWFEFSEPTSVSKYRTWEDCNPFAKYGFYVECDEGGEHLNLHLNFFIKLFGLIYNPFQRLIYLDIYGVPIRIEDPENTGKFMSPTFVNPKDTSYLDHITFVDKDGRERKSGESLVNDPDGSLSLNTMNIFYTSLNFLHCKNVKMQSEKIVLSRQQRRLLERKNTEYFEKYYVLQIEPMKKILDTEGEAQESGIKRAFHICRGHFAHFTEEKPLFGKYAGTFWKSAHTRGSADIGIINKDYKFKKV